jgi:hypothetical protein
MAGNLEKREPGIGVCIHPFFLAQATEAKITLPMTSFAEGDKTMCPIGLRRTARLLILAMVLEVGCVFDWSSHEAQAQQVQQGSQLDLDYSLPTRRGPKLRNVRRPPKMPPTPKDFGPHFDFPAGGSQNFNCGSGYGYYCGAPSEAPYPH